MKKITYICFLLFVCFSTKAQSVQLTDFSDGYDWLIGFEHAGDDRMFIIQKNGIIVIADKAGNQLQTPFLDISAKVDNSFQNEKGLLGLAFHPDYGNNRQFFVYYNDISNGDCVVSQFLTRSDNPNQADPDSETEIMRFAHPRGNHVGGCLKFGPDGYLYVGVGDGGGSGDPDKTGQNLTTFLGKIHRIDPDGDTPYSIPSDNPFINDASAKKEIWSWGLRNPWRFSFDRMTGDLWIADVGQNEVEEVNFQSASADGGENYGWSCREGSQVFNQNECSPGATYIAPAYEYPHTGGSCSGSISGGVVYRGMQFGDLWGKYIVTDFCTGSIYIVEKTNDTFSGRKIADFANSEYTVLDENNLGELFLTAFFSNKILKLESKNPAPTSVILGDDLTICEGEPFLLEAYNIAGSGMQFLWQKDGQDMLTEFNPTLRGDQSGVYTLKVTNPENGEESISSPITVAVRQKSIETIQVSAQPGDLVQGVTIHSDTSFSFTHPDRFGCDSTTTYVVNITSSTEAPSAEFIDLHVFPNPTKNLLIIDFQSIANSKIEINLHDLNGQLATRFLKKKKTTPGTHRLKKDISQLPAGLYLLSIIGNRGKVVKRIVKI